MHIATSWPAFNCSIHCVCTAACSKAKRNRNRYAPPYTSTCGGVAEWLRCDVSDLVRSPCVCSIPVVGITNHKPTVNAAVHPSEVGKRVLRSNSKGTSTGYTLITAKSGSVYSSIKIRLYFFLTVREGTHAKPLTPFGTS